MDVKTPSLDINPDGHIQHLWNPYIRRITTSFVFISVTVVVYGEREEIYNALCSDNYNIKIAG